MTAPLDEADDSFDGHVARRLIGAAATAIAGEEVRQLGGHTPTGGHGYYAAGIVATQSILRVLADIAPGTPEYAVEFDFALLADLIPFAAADLAAEPARDTRQWRVGSHYGLHLYAENPGTDRKSDEPLGTLLNAATARQVVDDHNRNLGTATDTRADGQG